MSKKYDAAAAQVDKDKLYAPIDALTLVKDIHSCQL